MEVHLTPQTDVMLFLNVSLFIFHGNVQLIFFGNVRIAKHFQPRIMSVNLLNFHHYSFEYVSIIVKCKHEYHYENTMCAVHTEERVQQLFSFHRIDSKASVFESNIRELA